MDAADEFSHDNTNHAAREVSEGAEPETQPETQPGLSTAANEEDTMVVDAAAGGGSSKYLS